MLASEYLASLRGRKKRQSRRDHAANKLEPADVLLYSTTDSDAPENPKIPDLKPTLKRGRKKKNARRQKKFNKSRSPSPEGPERNEQNTDHWLLRNEQLGDRSPVFSGHSSSSNDGLISGSTVPVWFQSIAWTGSSRQKNIIDFFLNDGESSNLLITVKLVDDLVDFGVKGSVVFQDMLERAPKIRVTEASTVRLAQHMPVQILRGLVDLSVINVIFDEMIFAAVDNKRYRLEVIPYFLDRKDANCRGLMVQRVIEECLDFPERTKYGRLPPFRLVTSLLDLYPDVEMTSEVIQMALKANQNPAWEAELDDCIERLMVRLPKHEITVDVLKTVMRRKGYTYGASLMERNSDIILTEKDFSEMLSIRMAEGGPNVQFDTEQPVVLDEASFVALIMGQTGQEVARSFRRNEFEAPVTELVLEAAATSLDADEFRRLLDSSDVAVTTEVLISAAQNTHFSNQVFGLAFQAISYTEVTDDLVVAAVTGLCPQHLRSILRKAPGYQVTERVITSVFRAGPDAVEKMRLVLNHLPANYSTVTEACCVAAIAHNHQNTIELVRMLGEKLSVRVTDHVVFATLRSSHTDLLLQLLFSMQSEGNFQATEQTFWAIATQRLDRETSEKIGRIVDTASHFDASGALVVASLDLPLQTQELFKMHSSPDRIGISTTDYIFWYKQKYRVHNLSGFDKFIDFGSKIEITDSLIEYRTWEFCTWMSKKMLQTLEKYENAPISDAFVSMVAQIDPPQVLQYLSKRLPSIDENQQDAILDWWIQHTGLDFRNVLDDKPSGAHDSFLIILTLCSHGLAQVANHIAERRPPLGSDCVELQKSLAAAVNYPQRFDAKPVLDMFPEATVNKAFFDALNTPIYGEKNWNDIFDRVASITWTRDAQNKVLRNADFDTVRKASESWLSQIGVTEQAVIAALHSRDFLQVLEFLWQQEPDLKVTETMLWIAIKRRAFVCVDFLLAKRSSGTFTEDMLTLSLEQDFSQLKLYEQHESLSVLEAMVGSFLEKRQGYKISNQMLELALKNCYPRIVKHLLPRVHTSAITDNVTCLMVEHGWNAELLQKILRSRGIIDISHRPQTLSKVLSTPLKSGEIPKFLELMGINKNLISDISPRASQFGYDKWGLYEQDRVHGYAYILDMLHTFDCLKMNEKLILSSWSSRYSQQNSVITRLLVSRARDVTFGFKSFKELSYQYSRNLHSSYQRRLPIRTIHIDAKIVKLSDYRVLNIVLGPEYDAIVQEDAIQEAARMSDVEMFLQLLSRAQEQKLIIQDVQGLLDAAHKGRVPIIIERCQELRKTVKS